MAVLASDSFTRADENTLASPWVKPTAWATACLVSNAAAVVTASTDAWYYYSGVTWPANQYAQCRVGVVGGGGVFDAGVVCRMNASGQDGYHLNYSDGASLLLYKVTGGSFSNIAARTVAVVAGDIIRLEVMGTTPTTTLKIFLNGVQQGADVTDSSTPITSGEAGIGLFGGTERLDDFEAGNFLAPGPTINTQPQGSSAVVGATTTFSVSATTSGGTLLYQWQYSTNGGETWASA